MQSLSRYPCLIMCCCTNVVYDQMPLELIYVQVLASRARWYQVADFDVEEGEMPEEGELPEEALQQSKRGRFEHKNHHKPFR